jgi:hypothetical protein
MMTMFLETRNPATRGMSHGVANLGGQMPPGAAPRIRSI